MDPYLSFTTYEWKLGGLALDILSIFKKAFQEKPNRNFFFFFFSFFWEATEISYDETNRFVLFFFVFSWHFRLNNYVIIKSLLKKWPQKYERKKRTYVNMHLNDQTSEVYIEAWSLIEINACKIWKNEEMRKLMIVEEDECTACWNPER